MGSAFRPPPQPAVAALGPADRLLVVGVGSGLALPRDVGTDVDLSDCMLRRARKRRDEIGTTNCELEKMDAHKLDPLIANFDVVYLPLIISVASNEPRF